MIHDVRFGLQLSIFEIPARRDRIEFRAFVRITFR